MQNQDQGGDARYDAMGIGIGPFNLSAAALCQPINDLKTLFFDRQAEFAWHPGLLISGATIQTSHLKDLVTLADPKSKYSFLSYLHSKKRMYRFITAQFDGVERAEFNDYFRWTADQLTNLRFGFTVESIEHDGRRFIVNGDERYTSRNLILGTGLSPSVPACAEPFLGDRVMHAHQLLRRAPDWSGRSIAIVGGGQSGAEVLNHVLADGRQLPEKVYWISSRENFLPLDESPFTNELFTPGYSDYFFELPQATRLFSLQSQKLASDGISARLLKEIYQRLYSLEFLRVQKPEVSLRPHTRLVGMAPGEGGGHDLVVENKLKGERGEIPGVDIVVLCTGYEYRMPQCLEGLRSRIDFADGAYQVEKDFSIRWDGPKRSKIYVQNAAINSRGIADPNLSLMAWRSANIVNDLMGHPYYEVQDSKDLKLWT